MPEISLADLTPDQPPELAIVLPDFAGGGAEGSVLKLARHFAEEGRRIDLVVFKRRGPLQRLLSDRIRVIDLGCVRAHRSPLGIARYIDRARPPVLHSAMIHTNVAASFGVRLARHKPRFIWSVHNLPEPIIQDLGLLRTPLFRVLLRMVKDDPERVLTVSEGVAAAYERMHPSLGPRLMPIYGPAIEPHKIPPRRPRAPGQPPKIIAVGRLSPQKNYPLMLEAFARLRQAREAELVIVGEGPDRAALEAQAAALGIAESVQMPGFVDEPMEWMADASLFVISSDYEGLANVIPEAMAVGLPVVSTDWPPSAREVLEDGRWGHIVPLRDPGALAEAMRDVLDNGGIDARERAQDFTIERAARIYGSVVFGPAPAEAPHAAVAKAALKG